MTHYGGAGGITNGRKINKHDKFEMDVSAAFGDLMRKDNQACHEVWSALSNIDWQHENGDDAAYSFRAAGDLVAAISGKGDYLTWYCNSQTGIVSDRFYDAMEKHGWTPIEGENK